MDNEMRELTVDELDIVSGGANSKITMDFGFVTVVIRNDGHYWGVGISNGDYTTSAGGHY